MLKPSPKKQLVHLEAKATEAYESVKTAISETSEKLDRRIEQMRAKLERRAAPRAELKAAR